MPRTLPALLTALLLLPSLALGAGFRIVVGPGSKDFPLALAAVVPGAPEVADEGQTLDEVVQRDLELTGYFRLIDRAAHIDRSGGVAPGTFNLDDWRMLKAGAVLKSSVIQQPGGKVQVDVYLYDTGTGEKLFGKRYQAPESEVRTLGHKISDEVLLALTGQRGLFGTRIAAVSQRSGNKEIYVMDADGTGVQQITRNGSINLSPALSDDGRFLAWTSFKRDNPDLYVKDLQRGTSQVISNREGINTGAAFSPDGKRIALARSANGDADIYILDAATGRELQRVTKGGGIDVAPDFHPTGDTLAFSSERSGGSQVYVQPLAGGEARRVSFSGSFNTDPVWSPDGTQIAFVGRDPRFDVFVVNADGSHMVRITQDQGDNEDPSWSPDGRYLIFSSTRTGRSEIWLSTPDGRHQAQISQGGGWTQPTWGVR
ncbi:MAG: Tol-Pal system beta propeller repeat protein TolB [Deltaproteobacteria bacterium]|nr:Tol-Pal system beta propeller repeat protein TolB [Deltaproteobacteria bacterium]